MAEYVVAGARDEQVADVEVRARGALEATAEDLLWCDGFILGTPENFGYMSGALKYFLDRVFYEAVDRTLAALLQQPRRGAVQEWLTGTLAGCRRWPVTRPFQVHQVFYLTNGARLEVVRVLHGARDLPSLLG